MSCVVQIEDVDLTRVEEHLFCLGVRDDFDQDTVDFRSASPIILVCFKVDVVVEYPLFEDKRAGADSGFRFCAEDGIGRTAAFFVSCFAGFSVEN